MTKIQCKENHRCNTCSSYSYDAFLRHEYDEHGFNSKYGEIAYIDSDNNWHYNGFLYNEEEQELININFEKIEKDEDDNLTLTFSGICPKCHKKYIWRKEFKFDYEMDI